MAGGDGYAPVFVYGVHTSGRVHERRNLHKRRNCRVEEHASL